MKASGIGSRAAVVAAILGFSAAFAMADLREWTSSAGSTLKAEFVRTISDKVILKKEDGKEMTVKLSQLSKEDQEYINSLGGKSAADTAANKAKLEAAIPKALDGKLVKFDGKKLASFDLAESEDGAPDFYAVYYSASWCGPCKAFTPDLVKFYKAQKRRTPNFEIIFVSSDRSEEDMEAYMDEDKMEWPALEFKEKAKTKEITKYAGRGIPCLVVIDPAGEVLSDSYVDGQYRGPRAVLKELEDMLKKSKPTDA